MRGFYIYILKRPNGTPFYVGKGSGLRIYDHAGRSLQAKWKNPHKDRIIRKILAAGEEICYEIDSVFQDEDLAFAREIELISQIGRHDLKTGPLTNLTSGGDGVVGNVVTAEVRARISASVKRYFEDPASQEWARKNLARMRESPVFQKTMVDSLARKRADPAFEEHRRRAHAAKLANPAHLAKISALAAEQWKDPEFHKVHSARNRQMGADPINLAKNSDAAKLRWSEGKYDACLKPVLVDGVRYESVSAAADGSGMNMSAVSARLNRYRKKGKFKDGWAYL